MQPGSVVKPSVAEDLFRKDIAALVAREPVFAGIVAAFGTPRPVRREKNFASLLHIILEQQVSLASARAVLDKLCAHTGPPEAASFLQLQDDTLRSFGFSRQKTRYARALATALVQGELDLKALMEMDDPQARDRLMRIKGIGHWTADVYLMMAMQRADIWPVGDLALAVAAQKLFGLAERPSPAELESLAEPWKPRRSAAAHLLWHFYLGGGL